jgi:NadR type nicotinamide-nucleotide adenylyltransferase
MRLARRLQSTGIDQTHVGSIRRVCLIGADCTGKTTLSQELALHFGTVSVPEFARCFLEARSGRFSYSDMARIAKGQLGLEHAAWPKAHRVLLCDGSPLATSVWSLRYFDRVSRTVDQLARTSRYDLYLFTRIDIPWTPDSLRDSEQWRSWLDAKCEELLKARSLPFVSVSGDREQRFKTAMRAVEALLIPPNDQGPSHHDSRIRRDSAMG